MEAFRGSTSKEPLLPVAWRETLVKITCDILTASGRLTDKVHSPEVLRRVAGLVRELETLLMPDNFAENLPSTDFNHLLGFLLRKQTQRP